MDISQNNIEDIQFPREGVKFFLINFGHTLREIYFKNFLYKHVIKFEIFSAPPSRVEINNLSATKTENPPPTLGDRMVAPSLVFLFAQINSSYDVVRTSELIIYRNNYYVILNTCYRDRLDN